MNRYTLHCTSEQTKKAIGLGAPIDFEQFVQNNGIVCTYPKNPTAEEMIGWLEEKLGITTFDIVRYPHCGYGYMITHENGIIECEQLEDCFLHRSRKEATLAAIDSALDYLTNNKK